MLDLQGSEPVVRSTGELTNPGANEPGSGIQEPSYSTMVVKSLSRVSRVSLRATSVITAASER